MKNELISMVDFVLAENKGQNCCEYGAKVIDYATFLNTPLNISMFVPAIKVGDKWEVLEEPETLDQSDIYIEVIHAKTNLKLWKQYQTAKEQCLFEGFEVYDPPRNSHGFSIINEVNGLTINFSLNQTPKHPFKTIQDLIKYAPTLTEYGKQISGLNK